MLGVGWGPSMPGTHPTLPGLPTLCMTQSNSLSIQSSSNAPGTRLCAVRTLHWCAPGAARAGAGRRHAATPVPAGGCDAAAPVPGGKAARAAGGWGSALLCLQGTCISTRCAARHAPAAEASSTPGGFSSGPCPAPARPRMCPPPPPPFLFRRPARSAPRRCTPGTALPTSQTSPWGRRGRRVRRC